MDRPVVKSLDALESELDRPAPNADALMAALSGLVIPGDVDAWELTRLYAACDRLMSGARRDDGTMAPAGRNAGFLPVIAAAKVEETLYDRNADTRRWIAERRARHRRTGKPIPQGLDDSRLPPCLTIPWDEATAAARLRPFLAHVEEQVKAEPAFHFRLCWNVARWGYPVVQAVFRNWLAGLEARGIGMPGTSEAIAAALALHDRVEALRTVRSRPDPVPWAACVRDMLPLLVHPHPMQAAAAARYLGALYGHRGFADPQNAASLPEMLDRLRGQQSHRAAVAGAFVDGFDTMSSGLGALHAAPELAAAGFDLDGWVLDVLAGEEETDLPNAQAFWFYVHEHYFARPDFVARLIDMDRVWVALMCATEAQEAVEGMEPVLRRLAANGDPQIARMARDHMDRFYRVWP